MPPSIVVAVPRVGGLGTKIFFRKASETLPGKGAEGASETPRYGVADPGAVSTFVGIRPGSNPRQPLLRDGDLTPFSMTIALLAS